MINDNNYKIVEIILDNNALQYICRNYYDFNLARISRLQSQKKIRLHFNDVVFYDRIKGLAENYFEDARDLIRKAAKICNKTILIPIKEHLVQCIKPFTLKQLLRIDKVSRDRLQNFSVSNDYKQAYDFVSGELSQLRVKREEFIRRADTLKDYNQESVFNELIRLYKINRYTRGHSKYSQKRKLKSLLYLADVDIYYRKQISSGIKPRESDYDDHQQILYLNICDYLISEDGKFRNRINNCSNNILKSRTLTAKEFLELLKLETFPLKKRAEDAPICIPTNIK